jgi:hypothetical protein
MKLYRLIFRVAVCLPIIISCVKEDNRKNSNEPKEGEEVKISFFTNMSPEIEMTTRTSANITDLMILIFDENNHYISRTKAILGEVDASGNRKFEATLISSGKNRYLHFVAGYDWTNFESDYDLIGTDEGDVIPKIVVDESPSQADRKTSYWARIALDGTAGYGTGIAENTFKNSVIMLARNRAKITLTVDPLVTNFTLRGYAVYNQPDQGNIAVFKYSNGTYTFTDGVVSVPADAGQLPNPSSNYFVGDNVAIELLEWNNNKGNIRTFVIFYGDYFDGITTHSYRFYKLDLVSSTNIGEVLDVIRNTHYHFILKLVDTPGYANAALAAAAPAGNNVFASLELQEYPSVSDGTGIMRVTQLEDIITNIAGKFITEVYYIPNISTPTVYNPAAITVTPLGNTDVTYWDMDYNIVGDGVTVEIGLMPGKTIPTTIEQPMVAEYKVVAGKIMRTLKVMARSPYQLNATTSLSLTQSLNQGGEATISFDVPSTISNSLFPLNLYIDAKFLSPNLSYSSEAIQVSTGGGSYRYIYKIAETAKGTTITLHFRVNKDVGTNESIILDASPYFARQTLNASWL